MANPKCARPGGSNRRRTKGIERRAPDRDHPGRPFSREAWAFFSELSPQRRSRRQSARRASAQRRARDRCSRPDPRAHHRVRALRVPPRRARRRRVLRCAPRPTARAAQLVDKQRRGSPRGFARLRTVALASRAMRRSRALRASAGASRASSPRSSSLRPRFRPPRRFRAEDDVPRGAERAHRASHPQPPSAALRHERDRVGRRRRRRKRRGRRADRASDVARCRGRRAARRRGRRQDDDRRPRGRPLGVAPRAIRARQGGVPVERVEVRARSPPPRGRRRRRRVVNLRRERRRSVARQSAGDVLRRRRARSHLRRRVPRAEARRGGARVRRPPGGGGVRQGTRRRRRSFDKLEVARTSPRAEGRDARHARATGGAGHSFAPVVEGGEAVGEGRGARRDGEGAAGEAKVEKKAPPRRSFAEATRFPARPLWRITARLGHETLDVLEASRRGGRGFVSFTRWRRTTARRARPRVSSWWRAREVPPGRRGGARARGAALTRMGFREVECWTGDECAYWSCRRCGNR